MLAEEQLSAIRGGLALSGTSQVKLDMSLGTSSSLLSLYLSGQREAPHDFDDKAMYNIGLFREIEEKQREMLRHANLCRLSTHPLSRAT